MILKLPGFVCVLDTVYVILLILSILEVEHTIFCCEVRQYLVQLVLTALPQDGGLNTALEAI